MACDSGSTNTAVTENQELGAVDSNTVHIPVTSEATAKAGVDNIKVEASAENVKELFLRERVELNGTDGQKHTAVLNSTSGHWSFLADYAEVKTANGDGTTLDKTPSIHWSETRWRYEILHLRIYSADKDGTSTTLIVHWLWICFSKY